MLHSQWRKRMYDRLAMNDLGECFPEWNSPEFRSMTTTTDIINTFFEFVQGADDSIGHTCPLCGKDTDGRVWQHFRDHHGVGPFKWIELLQNPERDGQWEVSVQCICGSRFPGSKEMWNHMTENPQQCYTVYLMKKE